MRLTWPVIGQGKHIMRGPDDLLNFKTEERQWDF